MKKIIAKSETDTIIFRISASGKTCTRDRFQNGMLVASNRMATKYMESELESLTGWEVIR